MYFIKYKIYGHAKKQHIIYVRLKKCIYPTVVKKSFSIILLEITPVNE